MVFAANEEAKPVLLVASDGKLLVQRDPGRRQASLRPFSVPQGFAHDTIGDILRLPLINNYSKIMQRYYTVQSTCKEGCNRRKNPVVLRCYDV